MIIQSSVDSYCITVNCKEEISLYMNPWNHTPLQKRLMGPCILQLTWFLTDIESRFPSIFRRHYLFREEIGMPGKQTEIS